MQHSCLYWQPELQDYPEFPGLSQEKYWSTEVTFDHKLYGTNEELHTTVEFITEHRFGGVIKINDANITSNQEKGVEVEGDWDSVIELFSYFLSLV